MNDFMTLRNYFIISLTASHLVSDFLLQTGKMAASKHKPVQFVKHLFITAAAIYIITGAFHIWILPLLFFLVHGIIDLLKIKIFKKNNKQLIPFLFDQILHLTSIVIAAFVIEYYSTSSLADVSFWIRQFGANYLYFLLWLSAIILITQFGSLLVDMAVKPFLEQIDADNSKRGFINGGKVIGTLERILIFLFIVSDNFSAVGFLIAAKSIFRFGELSNPANRKEAEYIIIGTMISFLLAITVGLGFNLAVRWIAG
jgi:hypothetical protein